MIQNILSFIVALGVLITFHEFGHYFVARRCGVKVLRFSVGFGKPLYRYVNRAGTEFTLALIPLGGYVRMLDEREGSVPEALLSQTFNRKSVWQRIAIVAAGPLANFILAVFLYFIIALMGMKVLIPVVGEVVVGSPASQLDLQKGDEIVQIQGIETNSWEQVNLALASLIGQSNDVSVRYLVGESDTVREGNVTLSRWLVGEEPSNLIEAFGWQPRRPLIPAKVAQVVEGGAADRAGLQEDDLILSAAGSAVENWLDFVKVVQNNPLVTIELDIERQGQLERVSITPASRETDDGLIGYVGLGVQPITLNDAWFRDYSYGFWGAWLYGIQQTDQMIRLTFSSVGKMLQGLISVDNLSGPITIAKVASASADSGLSSFLKFMAYLSVSLGVLNLLPIPMLDGGHLLFFSVEAIRRKPVSEKIQAFAYRIGAALLFSLMAIAIFNDIARL